MSPFFRIKIRLIYLLNTFIIKREAKLLESARYLLDRTIRSFPTPEDKEGYLERLYAENEGKNRKAKFDFLSSVGHALSLWSATEQQLVLIFGILIRNPPERAGVILYSVTNFNVWLSIIDELFASDPELASIKPKWNKINERLRSLKDTRDRLAHHTVVKDEYDAWQADFELLALTPSPYDTRKKSLKYQPLTLFQITDFIDTVATLNMDLAYFIDLLFDNVDLEADTSLDKPEKQDSDQRPTSDFLSRHFPKEPQDPPQSSGA